MLFAEWPRRNAGLPAYPVQGIDNVPVARGAVYKRLNGFCLGEDKWIWKIGANMQDYFHNSSGPNGIWSKAKIRILATRPVSQRHWRPSIFFGGHPDHVDEG
jgi:hypothetical protein